MSYTTESFRDLIARELELTAPMTDLSTAVRHHGVRARRRRRLGVTAVALSSALVVGGAAAALSTTRGGASDSTGFTSTQTSPSSTATSVPADAVTEAEWRATIVDTIGPVLPPRFSGVTDAGTVEEQRFIVGSSGPTMWFNVRTTAEPALTQYAWDCESMEMTDCKEADVDGLRLTAGHKPSDAGEDWATLTVVTESSVTELSFFTAAGRVPMSNDELIDIGRSTSLKAMIDLGAEYYQQQDDLQHVESPDGEPSEL
jgi:hypothetical protein